jgi:hypothetical protein
MLVVMNDDDDDDDDDDDAVTGRECFVYKFHPEFTVYKWTGKNDYYVLSNPNHLAMGGGGGFAFQLDDELDTGVSGPSDTFGNTRLSSRGMFKCLSIEIWGFDEIGHAI